MKYIVHSVGKTKINLAWKKNMYLFRKMIFYYKIILLLKGGATIVMVSCSQKN